MLAPTTEGYVSHHTPPWPAGNHKGEPNPPQHSYPDFYSQILLQIPDFLGFQFFCLLQLGRISLQIVPVLIFLLFSLFQIVIAHSAYADSPLGPDAFHEYESLLVQDYDEIMMESKKSENHSNLKNETGQAAEGDHLDILSANGDCSSQLASRVDDDLNAESVSVERDLYNDSKSTEANSSTKLQVIVHHFPMLLCAVSPRFFVFPSEGAVAEACLSNNHENSLSPGLPSICNGVTSDGEDVPPGAILTAHFLYNLVAKMDLKMEVFSLGDTSKVIGKMLTDMSGLYDVGRRNRRSAGLLLIDRTLDLLTPCCHGDSFLDRMLSSLSRRDGAISAMKSSHSSNRNLPAEARRATLDIRIPFSKILSNEDSNMSISKLEENVKAFMSGWNPEDVNSEGSYLSDNAGKLQNNKFDNESYSLSGSILSNYTGANYLEDLLDRRTKDGILLIKKWLMEALQREKVPLKGFLASTPLSELHAMVKKLVPDQISLVRNRGIIRLALAAEIALSEPHRSRWDAFVSAERILNVNSLDNSQSLSSQIRDLINTSSVLRSHEDRNMGPQAALLSFQDALLLSIVGYILAGENFPKSGSGSPFSWEEEHLLKEAIVHVIFQNPELTKLQFLHGLEKDLEANARKEDSANDEDDFDEQWGSWDDEETDHQNDQAYGDMQLKLELRDRVDLLFKLFHKLSELKSRTPSFMEGPLASSASYGNDPCDRKGLIYKLLTAVMAKYDIPGLEYHSSAVGRFFKSGFGRFGIGQAKPYLADQNVLLFFVVGGVNFLEIHEAMEAISESNRPDMELLIGGTTLLTPDDMYDLLLGSSSYI
ncbi:sec1 family domain-containing protein MIP3 isoform X2 [Phalaenopsis equestris]|uniref:sec1 family domain-containing protein MIP3 isoform X2 n=1 Tax=Phalaenopsis equestris TaxID=78828 RepID=UPI0009E540AB|nr:sec1 family domain-containing protein MIP3 isoform X2 [Phalaenopsis equestris]